MYIDDDDVVVVVVVVVVVDDDDDDFDVVDIYMSLFRVMMSVGW